MLNHHNNNYNNNNFHLMAPSAGQPGKPALER